MSLEYDRRHKKHTNKEGFLLLQEKNSGKRRLGFFIPFSKEFYGKRLFIGRHKGNNIALPSIYKYISRVHASVLLTKEHDLLLFDECSHSGTYVTAANGDHVRVYSHAPVAITDQTILFTPASAHDDLTIAFRLFSGDGHPDYVEIPVVIDPYSDVKRTFSDVQEKLQKTAENEENLLQRVTEMRKEARVNTQKMDILSKRITFLKNSRKAVTIHTKEREQISKLVLDSLQECCRCCICMHPYISPVMLPCQHVYCERCVSFMSEATNKPVCPLCRASFEEDAVRPSIFAELLRRLYQMFGMFDVEFRQQLTIWIDEYKEYCTEKGIMQTFHIDLPQDEDRTKKKEEKEEEKEVNVMNVTFVETESSLKCSECQLPCQNTWVLKGYTSVYPPILRCLHLSCIRPSKLHHLKGFTVNLSVPYSFHENALDIVKKGYNFLKNSKE
ncbi:hypothetical protein PCE1_004029 [Barthelona sp. PCE]